MKITHFSSSTELIDVGGIRILTDPWLVDGEYYGSWYHCPLPPVKPEEVSFDYIYISHIHPDHMSHKTLERLDRSKPVLIHNFEEKFLKRNLESLGYEVIELTHGSPYALPGGGSVRIFAADDCNPELCGKWIGCAPLESKFKFTQIDSLCVMTDGKKVILNTNDCPFGLARTVIDKILQIYPRIDLLLVGYAGAGPYPQCFAFPDDAVKVSAANRKRDQFIRQAVEYINYINPVAYMPFAGTYVLGGRLASLNEMRGVPSLSEAIKQIEAGLDQKGRGFLLNAGGIYDLVTGSIDAPYREQDVEARRAYITATTAAPYDYDNDPEVDDELLLQLARLAHLRFQKKAAEINFVTDTSIVIGDGEKFCFSFGPEAAPKRISPEAIEKFDRFVEINVDRRLLNRLLNGPSRAHWNNAEIGSHLKIRRRPDVFERALYYCLSSFHR
jgi:UDP-MurNAc hydroxylase